MGKKIVTLILLALITVGISGCTSTTSTTSNPSDNLSNNATSAPNDISEHPIIIANVSESNITKNPIMIVPAPKTLVTKESNAAPVKANKVYSTNWAGYSAISSKGSVTDVKGSWIVPRVSTKTANQYSCNWIGIDGYNSNTVEQVGTDSDTDSRGNPVYYAWYEFYPQPCYYVPLTISPGDKITTEVSYSNGKITLQLTDVNTKESFSITKDGTKYDRSCAEWIVEAPYYNGVLPLANFGTTSFGKAYTTATSTCFATINGKTNNINAFGPAVNFITMVNNNNQIKALPGALSSDGTSFQTTWVRAS